MLTFRRSFLSLLSLLVLLTAALAQHEHTANPAEDSALVTASVNGERLRCTASSSVQIRLEVYSSTGNKIFDNQVRGANLIDWNFRDAQAQPLPYDSYLCVITTKSLSGKLSQTFGSLRVESNSLSLQPLEPSQMTAQQTQAIAPAEENIPLTVLEDENQTTTVIGHNGEEGQITRGRGALSFRIGDFFTGKDIEQMRLTAEGNLGIGITHPQVRLDIDGLIRASQGIMFPDGTIQTTAAVAAGSSQGSTGQPQIGPGSKPIKQGKTSSENRKGQNTVSPETLINDDLTVNGSIFFTTGSPRDLAMLNNTGGVRIYSAPTLTNSPASAAIQFFGTGSAFTGQAYIDSGAHDNAAVIFRTAGTGGTIAERMRITSSGKIGIGTTNPGEKLEVGGNALIYPTSGAGSLQVRNRTNGDFSQVIFLDDSNMYRAYVGYNGANAPLNAERKDTVEFGTNGKIMTFRPNESEVMRLTNTGNVGIGTMSVNAKLQVNGGDAAIATQGNGLILKATDGPNCFRLTVNNAGALSTTPITCP
ncbi:MAG TPA: hypothetical protein VGL29_05245 [Blastocatellia bacterium]